jgi:hypothetical protein
MNSHDPLFSTGDYVCIDEGITPGIYKDVLELLGADFGQDWCAVIEGVQFSDSTYESCGLLRSCWHYDLTELYPNHGHRITLNQDFVAKIEPSNDYDISDMFLLELFFSGNLTRIKDLFVLGANPQNDPLCHWTVGIPDWIDINNMNYATINP